MRNLLRTALILGTLTSSVVVFADGEVKSPPPATKKPVAAKPGDKDVAPPSTDKPAATDKTKATTKPVTKQTKGTGGGNGSATK